MSSQVINFGFQIFKLNFTHLFLLFNPLNKIIQEERNQQVLRDIDSGRNYKVKYRLLRESKCFLHKVCNLVGSKHKQNHKQTK